MYCGLELVKCRIFDIITWYLQIGGQAGAVETLCYNEYYHFLIYINVNLKYLKM